jgi:hypothetical protein
VLRTNLAEAPVTKAITDGRVTSDIDMLNCCNPELAQNGFKPTRVNMPSTAVNWPSLRIFRRKFITSPGCCYSAGDRVAFEQKIIFRKLGLTRYRANQCNGEQTVHDQEYAPPPHRFSSWVRPSLRHFSIGHVPPDAPERMRRAADSRQSTPALKSKRFTLPVWNWTNSSMAPSKIFVAIISTGSCGTACSSPPRSKIRFLTNSNLARIGRSSIAAIVGCDTSSLLFGCFPLICL